jgi:hypothetical protein
MRVGKAEGMGMAALEEDIFRVESLRVMGL